MSYQVLARKWRPKKFQEVIGQGHVTRALQNAIINNKIGHAYMLVGTRGVGKTSVARIFAKAIRCENLTADGNACGECKACLDFDTETSMNVIEIDGASNNSVDNIRELIGNVHYLPTSGRFKVYIIDEVHMLSTNAFNALLKTLEEPPAHVVFIFATTEAHKLLGTVLSRCQRFDFRNVSVADLTDHVKEIAKVEGIKFEREELIHQLAVLGRGSVRDTLSLLDQVLTTSQNDIVTEEHLTASLGVAGPSSLRSILSSLYAGDTAALSKMYNKLLDENVPVKNIASGLLDELFSDLKTNKDFGEAELIWIYETVARETSWIFTSIAPEKAFEVLMYKAALRRSFFTNKIKSGVNQPMPEKQAEVQSERPEEKQVEKPSVASQLQAELERAKFEVTAPVSPSKAKEEVESPVIQAPQSSVAKDLTWEGFLAHLNSKSPASASNLEQGNITSPLCFENGELSVELGFGYSGMVFYDYLSDGEVHEKLVNNLADYFGIDKSKVHFELKQVQSDENFVSTAALKEQQAEITLQEQVESFKNNPLLKEAEKIFNAKVDKIIIDNKK
ncbi:MAG: DNA polymerase III subunit gamma/tau [Bacteriovorax sp.]